MGRTGMGRNMNNVRVRCGWKRMRSNIIWLRKW
jgi:hypothetical protein